MTTYNQKEINNFLTRFIMVERASISNLLANNSEILAINLAEEMIYVGLPMFYVAAITGVPIYELDSSQQVRH